jgi:hypothetical protein
MRSAAGCTSGAILLRKRVVAEPLGQAAIPSNIEEAQRGARNANVSAGARRALALDEDR